MYNICSEGDSLPRSWLPGGIAYNQKYAWRSQAERSGRAGGESQLWQPSYQHWQSSPPRAFREGRQPVRLCLLTTAPQRNPARLLRWRCWREPLPALGEHSMLQLRRIRGHLCILLRCAALTVAEPFLADICPIYFQNPPTATLSNLFLCFPSES